MFVSSLWTGTRWDFAGGQQLEEFYENVSYEVYAAAYQGTEVNKQQN